jgi:hypothetical protein
LRLSKNAMSVRQATIHIGVAGKFGVWRGIGGGVRSDSVVANIAVQVVVLLPAVHFAAAPSAAVPFMNCTVPLGGAPLDVVTVTVAVSVSLPPEAIDVALGVTTVVVACFAATVTVVCPVDTA